MLDRKTNQILNRENNDKDRIRIKHAQNVKNISYHSTTMHKFMLALTKGISAIGEGMEKQHDEDLITKRQA